MRCYLRPIPSCQETTVEAAAHNSAFERAIKKPAPGFQVFPTQADSNKSAKQQHPKKHGDKFSLFWRADPSLALPGAWISISTDPLQEYRDGRFLLPGTLRAAASKGSLSTQPWQG